MEKGSYIVGKKKEWIENVEDSPDWWSIALQFCNLAYLPARIWIVHLRGKVWNWYTLKIDLHDKYSSESTTNNPRADYRDEQRWWNENHRKLLWRDIATLARWKCLQKQEAREPDDERRRVDRKMWNVVVVSQSRFEEGTIKVRVWMLPKGLEMFILHCQLSRLFSSHTHIKFDFHFINSSSSFNCNVVVIPSSLRVNT